jgi:hypothetical protein
MPTGRNAYGQGTVGVSRLWCAAHKVWGTRLQSILLGVCDGVVVACLNVMPQITDGAVGALLWATGTK